MTSKRSERIGDMIVAAVIEKPLLLNAACGLLAGDAALRRGYRLKPALMVAAAGAIFPTIVWMGVKMAWRKAIAKEMESAKKV